MAGSYGAARYPTMPGYLLVSPKRHIEHVVRDLGADAYLELMRVGRKVALAVEPVVPSERTSGEPAARLRRAPA
ncbi:hypothetical protein E1292_12975 [Nonomuraea deserti]|uniref:Uncharacterized protein n=1 Tax=Nonomuraea deserti TaxID=1848322 RepID=A0A4R4VR53_9ACTN|nr:hypothetical protein [Nonomuraea deserti]TDD07671.1 hypothetical protein E1292_12975 [Nonomuraea deserti]